MSNSETGKERKRRLPGSWPTFLTLITGNTQEAGVLTNSETGKKGRLYRPRAHLSDITDIKTERGLSSSPTVKRERKRQRGLLAP